MVIDPDDSVPEGVVVVVVVGAAVVVGASVVVDRLVVLDASVVETDLSLLSASEVPLPQLATEVARVAVNKAAVVIRMCLRMVVSSHGRRRSGRLEAATVPGSAVIRKHALWLRSHGKDDLHPMPGTPKEPLSPATIEFGRRVRARREELGWSQEKLAEQSGLHWTYVGQVERGRRNVTLHNILKLAGGLDIDAGALVERLPGEGPSTA